MFLTSLMTLSKLTTPVLKHVMQYAPRMSPNCLSILFYLLVRWCVSFITYSLSARSCHSRQLLYVLLFENTQSSVQRRGHLGAIPTNTNKMLMLARFCSRAWKFTLTCSGTPGKDKLKVLFPNWNVNYQKRKRFNVEYFGENMCEV